MLKKTTKAQLLVVCAALSVMSIIVSNVITNKQMDFFNFALPCGTLLVPVDYIMGDLITEVYGYRTAKNVILVAFFMNLLAVIFFMLTLALPSFYTFTNQDAFVAVLGSTPRILAASFAAFIFGSFANAKIMAIMHVRDGEDKLAWRCIASTIVGETLDMSVFSVLAFGGVLPWSVIFQMIWLNSLVKIAIECILYALATRHIIKWAKGLDA